MALPALLRATTVQRLFNISRRALSRWEELGLLRGTLIAHEIHYYTDELDALLAKGSVGFTPALTMEDLVQGRVTLATSDEAMECLHLTRGRLHYRAHAGKLRAVLLVRRWRFDQESLLEARQAELEDDRLSRQVVARILGLTVRSVITLADEGHLKATTSAQHPIYRPIQRDSLLALLRELLPEWIDPRDWLEDRLENDEPLLTLPAAAAMLSIKKTELQQHMRDQHIQYINWPSGKRQLVLPDSVHAYLENTKPVPVSAIARLFGVAHSAVYKWIEAGKLQCPIKTHIHDKDVLYRACLIGLLGIYLSPSMQPGNWYRLRIESRTPLLSEEKAAAFLSITVKQLERLVDGNVVKGIRTPLGSWRFTTYQLLQVRREGSAK